MSVLGFLSANERSPTSANHRANARTKLEKGRPASDGGGFLAKAVRASPTFAFWLEWRALIELAQYAIQGRSLVTRCPRGDGRPVLVIPGFLANDLSTV